MAENDLIQRFKLVQDQARDSFANMEAVLRDDTIIFRQGRGCRIWSTTCGTAFIAVFCLMLLFGHFPQLVSSLWAWAAVVVLGALAFRRLPAHATSRPAWLEILTNEREIVVYPEKKAPIRLSLASIHSFVAHLPPGTEGHYDRIYGICDDGKMPELTPWLGAYGRLEANAKLLGAICNLPAYCLEKPVGMCEFIRVRVDGGFELLDEAALVAASEVIYAPGRDEEA